jgi:hypothetical protein
MVAIAQIRWHRTLLSRSVDLFGDTFRWLGFEELTWTVRVSVVQFTSSVSALGEGCRAVR